MNSVSRSLSPSNKFLAASLSRTGHVVRRFLIQKASIIRQSPTTTASAVKPTSMTVASPVSGLEPANVWGFFEQLTKIPRPSKHEEK